MKFNSLNIIKSHLLDECEGKQALRFLQCCSQTSLQRLSKIEIRCDVYIGPSVGVGEGNLSLRIESLVSLAKLCRANPHLTLNIRLPKPYKKGNFDIDDVTYCMLLQSFAVKIIYRGEIFICQHCEFQNKRTPVEKIENAMQKVSIATHYELVESLVAPNMRFWPSDQHFDEKRFHKVVRRSSFPCLSCHLPTFRQDDLVASVRHWYLRGL